MIIESQSKIEYFGHNRTQSKSRYRQGIVRFRSHTLFSSCTISVLRANKPSHPGVLQARQQSRWSVERTDNPGDRWEEGQRPGGWTAVKCGNQFQWKSYLVCRHAADCIPAIVQLLNPGTVSYIMCSCKQTMRISAQGLGKFLPCLITESENVSKCQHNGTTYMSVETGESTTSAAE